MNDENGGNGRRRRNRNAAIGGVTQTEQEIQEQIVEEENGILWVKTNREKIGNIFQLCTLTLYF